MRIGVFQTATTELLPGALRTLREQRPDVEVVLSEIRGQRAHVRSAGRPGASTSPSRSTRARTTASSSIPLLDDPWVILTRRDSELAAAEMPTFDLLDGVDVVAWNRRWRTQEELERAWRQRGISPRVVYRTDDNLALQRLVAAGYGHACLDRLGASGAVEPSLTWLEPKEIARSPHDRALLPPSRRQRRRSCSWTPSAPSSERDEVTLTAEAVCDNAARARGPAMTETTLTAAPPGPLYDARLRSARARPPARSRDRDAGSAAAAGEVLVRIAAAGVCHSDVHLADGQLGDGRWPIVLGHEGAGVVEAVGDGRDRPGGGRPRGLLPGRLRAASARRAAPAAGRCASPRAPTRRRHPADGRTSRLRGADGSALQHGLTIACFAEHAVVSADSGDPDRRATCRCGRRRCSGCGVDHRLRRRHPRRRGADRRARRVIGCGGVGLQVIAAARLAGAAQIVAVDRRPEKLEHALAPRRHPRRRRVSRDDPAAEVIAPHRRRRRPRLRGRRAPRRRSALAWDALRPGGTAVVVGLAPAGVEVSLPAIEFLSEKSIIGSYYGTGDPVAGAARPRRARRAPDGWSSPTWSRT